MKKKGPSRSARWSAACAKALEGLEELVELQGEYQGWLDNLPDNLQSSALGDKLNEVTGLSLEDAKGTVEEADGLDLPQGFGRD
jgi:hypothetical protein